MFLEHFYKLFDIEDNLENIIWSDGPISEFKVVSHFVRIMLLCICKDGLGSKTTASSVLARAI